MYDIDPTIVEFRHEDTRVLLWRSVLPLPADGETVYYAVGSGAVTEFLVTGFDRTYRAMVVEGPSPGGGEVEIEGGLSNVVPVVLVAPV